MTSSKTTAGLRTEPDCTDSLIPFWQRVAETIAWCQPRIDPKSPRDCLRNIWVRGRTLERSYHDCVASVARARKQELWPNRPVPAKDLAAGRLLLYFPNADLCDGASEAVSQGFFDVYNTPPWDTWVAFVTEPEGKDISYSEYLIAWVPPEFIDLATTGILVNPEECIRWLDESGVSFAQLVRGTV